MRKFFASAVADVPPLHLNSRNDMSRASAVEIIASPRTWGVLGVWLIPTVVFTISRLLSQHDLQLVNGSLEVNLSLQLKANNSCDAISTRLKPEPVRAIVHGACLNPVA